MTDEFEKPVSHETSEATWADIEALYGTGDFTIDQIATRFDMTASNVSAGLGKRGIKKGGKLSKVDEVRDKVRAMLHKAGLQNQQDQKIRIDETREDHYKYAKTLAKLTFSLIAQRVTARQSISLAKDEMKTLREAAATLAIIRQERYAILGMDRDDRLGDEPTELVIREMTAEDIAELRAKQRDTDVDGDLDVAELDKIVETMSDGPVIP